MALGSQPVLLGGCLVLTSCIMSLLALVLDLVIAELYRLRVQLCNASEGWQRMGVWTGSAALLALLAAIVTHSTTRAAGSGVGHVKQALAGKHSHVAAFTLRVLVVKCLSLVCAVASGLAVGKEGPFIHVACCVAHMIANRLRPEVRATCQHNPNTTPGDLLSLCRTVT